MNPTHPALYNFIRNLFSEIVQVFPDQYLHLGGDEVPFDCWGSNPEIGEYMKRHNMSKRYELLENQYIANILAISKTLDANTIVWQEVSVLFFCNHSYVFFFLQLIVDTIPVPYNYYYVQRLIARLIGFR